MDAGGGAGATMGATLGTESVAAGAAALGALGASGPPEAHHTTVAAMPSVRAAPATMSAIIAGLAEGPRGDPDTIVAEGANDAGAKAGASETRAAGGVLERVN